jgi:Spy/CpxP family protein refolding chaperone
MNWKLILTLAGVAGALSLTSTTALAQQPPQNRPGRGNMTPEEMRQRIMDRVKEQLEIKSEEEWKIIQPRIEKAMEARGGMGFGGMGRMGGPPPGRGPGGPDNNAADPNQNRRRMGPPPNPDAEALQKALEAKASTEEIKAKLAKLRESRKEREAKMAQAMEDLRKVLTLRQEATAVLNGWMQ